ncbi:MAG TPA: ABC transporter ATP-binding protein [Polyangiaceae bacterium]|nr:ABC transporter ATP-binding protein [Polyangiaceae bacterium]
MSRLFGAGTYALRAFRLVWDTNRRLCAVLTTLSVLAGVLPAAVAYVGKLIVDTVVAAMTGAASETAAVQLIGLEFALIVLLLGAYRGLSLSEALLRVQLGQRVTELLMRKALDLEIADFEDPLVHDELARVREQAKTRPLSLVRGVLSSLQDAIALAGYVALLTRFSWVLVAAILAAAIPALFAELRLNADAFRLFKAHTPEARKQNYLEQLATTDTHAKELRLHGAASLILTGHRRVFDHLYYEDRGLAIRRGGWGLGVTVVGALALALAYAWVARATINSEITVGGMVMLFAVLRQSQGTLATFVVSTAGLYEDNLYLTTLYRVLERETNIWPGTATAGPDKTDGLRFEHVSFCYPGCSRPTLEDVSVHLPPGKKLAVVGRNGAGKSTLLKLATALYPASTGTVLMDGLDVREWDRAALRRRLAVMVQDFSCFQFSAGRNIGISTPDRADDEVRWNEAAKVAQIDAELRALPQGYATQLGKWFADGHELSLGQWQRVALARAFYKVGADYFLFDEATSKLDPPAEKALAQHMRDLPFGVSALLISHRPWAAEIADEVIVMDAGRVVEHGHWRELQRPGTVYSLLYGLPTEPPGDS